MQIRIDIRHKKNSQNDGKGNPRMKAVCRPGEQLSSETGAGQKTREGCLELQDLLLVHTI